MAYLINVSFDFEHDFIKNRIMYTWIEKNKNFLSVKIGMKKKKIFILDADIHCLILTAYQPVKGYFMHSV